MKKKYLSTAAAVLAVCMAFSGCTGGAGSSAATGSTAGTSAAAKSQPASTAGEPATTGAAVTPAGELPIVKEPVTVKLALEKSGQVEDYVDNSFTKYIEEKTGIKLELEIFPGAEANQKMEVLIASGAQLPDAFVGGNFFGSTRELTVFRHAQNGTFIQLDDMLEKYGVNIKDMATKAQNKELLERIKSPDGHVYALPQYHEQTSNEHSLRAYINQVWLDNLKLEMPKTTDDLYNVLKAFKEQDANGNGQNDEIGMMGGGNWHQMAADWMMNSFIYDDGELRWNVKDGKLDVPYNKPEWKEGLTYLNKLCSEGLFDPLTFTQDGPAFKSIATAGDKNSIGVIVTAGMGQLFTTSMTDRKAEYVPLDPAVGPQGVQYAAYYPTQPSPVMAITKDCKNPEVLFRLADFFFDQEAALFSRFGEPGVDWTEPDANGEALGAAYGAECTIKPILIWGGSSQKSHWSNVTPNIQLRKWMDGQQWNGDPTDAEYMIAQSTATLIDKAPEEACNLIVYDIEEAEQIADIQTSLQTYVKESMARFTTGDMSVEKDWDSYVKELDNIGLQTYIEVSQKAYDRMNGKS